MITIQINATMVFRCNNILEVFCFALIIYTNLVFDVAVFSAAPNAPTRCLATKVVSNQYLINIVI
jgi:hypothetical protein